jgi:hypothetical protein
LDAQAFEKTHDQISQGDGLMNFSRVNVFLLVLLLIQGIWLGKNLVSDDAGQEDLVPMTTMKREDFTALTLVSKQGKNSLEVKLKKVDGIWVLPEKFDFPVVQSRVDELLYSITSLNLGRAVTKSKASQSKLYVSDRMFARKITWKNGSKVEGFYMGTPAGVSYNKTHVRRLDGEEVYQAEIFNAWQVGVSSRDWISPIFMDLNYDEVIEFVQIRRNREGFSSDNLNVRKINGVWILQGAPVKREEPFDSVSFASYLKEQMTWNLEEIVGKNKNPKGSHLNDPFMEMIFTLLDRRTGKERKVTISVGAKVPDTEGFYVRTTESPWIYLLSPKKTQTFVPKSDFFGDGYRKRREFQNKMKLGDPDDSNKQPGPPNK